MINIIFTLGGMWLGTKLNPTPEDEKERVESFFNDLKKPFVIDESGGKQATSPFGIIGIIIGILGIVMSGLALFILQVYGDMEAFTYDLAIGVFMFALGIFMYRKGGKPKEAVK
jgi:hypothetical protein